jgi:hypothetical protein
MGRETLDGFAPLFCACFQQELAICKPYFPITAATDETGIALIQTAMEQNQMEMMG